ncbi:MAG: methionyl-tRNA formyltransferase [Fimbriimonadaceae bacterium]|nr:methionyl-tRNA formyltransferase [Fimbriimonadaceae bacterium]QYK56049.1 MAG: methionyl-tRNA formyltransferase [Fimbriimonadaceae bacterium]
MKVVYMGTADFAVPALRAVAPHVALVVSQPDRPSGRGLDLKPSPVKKAAIELGLPVETPVKSRAPEFVESIRRLDADCLLVAAYGQILSEAMLGATRRGGINLHGSLLPRYRGAAPIQRAVEAGETYTGVTLMQMDKGMDTGDIIVTESCSIGPDETAGELFARLAGLAAELARSWLPLIVAGDYPRQKQDDAFATHAAKVTKAEAELQPQSPAKLEYNRFRAFTPFPGAFLRTKDGPLKVTQARLVTDASPGPGVVAMVKGGLVVGFTDGAINLLEVQQEGKRRMSGPEYANGARLSVGDRLTE